MNKYIVVFLLAAVACRSLRFMDNIGDKTSASPEQKGQAAKMNGIGNLTNAINQICDTWTKVVTTFKTTHSKKVKEIIPGKGFSKLNLVSELYINIGLADSKYDAYYAARAKTINLKDAYLQKFKDTFEFAFWSENGVWNKCEMVYDDEAQANHYDSVTILVTESAKPDRHDIMIAYMTAEFNLAPDLLYIEDSKSILGGIFEGTKEYYEKKPKELTDEEIIAIISMYKMFSLKFVADVLGIKLTIPSLD